jgi:hypothetical protein
LAINPLNKLSTLGVWGVIKPIKGGGVIKLIKGSVIKLVRGWGVIRQRIILRFNYL